MTRKTQTVETYLENEGPDFALFTTYLGYISGSIVEKKFGVMLRGRLQQPEFAYDIVRIHYFVIYKQLIEENIVDGRNVPSVAGLLFLYFEAESWRKSYYRKTHEQSDL